MLLRQVHTDRNNVREREREKRERERRERDRERDIDYQDWKWVGHKYPPPPDAKCTGLTKSKISSDYINSTISWKRVNHYIQKGKGGVHTLYRIFFARWSIIEVPYAHTCICPLEKTEYGNLLIQLYLLSLMYRVTSVYKMISMRMENRWSMKSLIIWAPEGDH